jgi:hypothetical protein
MASDLYQLIETWPAEPSVEQQAAFAAAWAQRDRWVDADLEMTVMTAAGAGQLSLLQHMAPDLSPHTLLRGLAPAAAGGHEAVLVYLLSQAAPVVATEPAARAFHGLATTWAVLYGQVRALELLLQSGHVSPGIRCQAVRRCQENPSLAAAQPLLEATLTPADWAAYRQEEAFGARLLKQEGQEPAHETH